LGNPIPLAPIMWHGVGVCVCVAVVGCGGVVCCPCMASQNLPKSVSEVGFMGGKHGLTQKQPYILPPLDAIFKGLPSMLELVFIGWVGAKIQPFKASPSLHPAFVCLPVGGNRGVTQNKGYNPTPLDAIFKGLPSKKKLVFIGWVGAKIQPFNPTQHGVDMCALAPGLQVGGKYG